MDLIPRELLFGNRDIVNVQISPDGQWISYISPADCTIIYVAPSENSEKAKPIRTEQIIQRYIWSYADNYILFIQDSNGDENWHICTLNIETEESMDLTPFSGISAEIQQLSHIYKDEILVLINNQDPGYHNVFKINIKNGTRELLYNNMRFESFYTDDHLGLRFASQTDKEGKREIYQFKNNSPADLFFTIPFSDSLTTDIFSINRLKDTILLVSSIDRNTSAVMEMDIQTGKKKLIAEDSKADIHQILQKVTGEIEAVSFFYLKKKWKAVNQQIQNSFDLLRSHFKDNFDVLSRSMDNQKWIIKTVNDNKPERYYLYNSKTNTLVFLFSSRLKLEQCPLQKTKPVIIKSRDGLDLISYLTLPKHVPKMESGLPEHPLPLVLLVHGGPYSRDFWGFNIFHQWLANRNYAVLSVNFRGSVGFGKEFVNKSIKEWGGKMHFDLIDGVDWAIDKGIADPDRIAICGRSYGGYATLIGLSKSPERFACGVDVCGPSDLLTFFHSIPHYWTPMLERIIQLIGDSRTKEGQKLLKERSPITYADHIKKPLLIAQGVNDPRVRRTESDQIVEILQKNQVPVIYLIYPDEGHELIKYENQLSFYAITEVFLARHLKGTHEELKDELNNSSVIIQKGKEYLKTLSS